MAKLLNSLLWCMFIITSIGCIYLGSSGWTYLDYANKMSELSDTASGGVVYYDGLPYSSLNDALKEIQIEQFEESVFSRLFAQNSAKFNFLMTAVAFGCLGGCYRVLSENVFTEGSVKPGRAFLMLCLGGFAGVIFTLVASVGPDLISVSDTELKAEVVIFLSFCGGVFYRKLYEWLTNSFSLNPTHPQ